MAEEKPVIALSLTIKDLSLLYATYMSFLVGGGLFIPTKKKFQMNDMLKLTLTLMDEQYKYTVSGRVAWITPENANNNKAQGIGIGFIVDEASKALNKKITSLLEKGKFEDQNSYTM